MGQGVDLLVIMSQFENYKNNIYFFKPSLGTSQNKIYTSDSFKYEEIKNCIAILNAFSGCDTTTSIFNQGKGN